MPRPSISHSITLRRPWIVLGLVVLLSHGISVVNGFVFDDDLLLVNNSSVKDPEAFMGSVVGSLFEDRTRGGALVYFRPMVTTTYFLTYQAFGLSPLPYHVTNLAIHLFNAWLLVIVLRLWFRTPRVPALLAAALWAAHPIHTEAVAWISGRTDVLCATGILGAMIFAWRWVRRGGLLNLLGFALLTGVGLLSKELGVVIAALLAVGLWVRWPALGRALHAGRRAAVAVTLAIVLSLLFVLWRSHALAGLEASRVWPTRDPHTTLLTVPNMLMLYARLLLWPHPYTLDYTITNFGFVTSPMQVLFWFPLAACAAIAVVAALAALRRRSLGLALAWFWIAIAPVSQIRPLNIIAAERYLYLPSVTFAAIAGLVLMWMLRRPALRRATFVGATSLLLIFCLLSTSRSLIWRDNLTLFTHAHSRDPGDAHKVLQFAEILMGLGRHAEALELLRRNDHSLAYPPMQMELEGTALINMGRAEEGLALIERAVAWPTRRARAHNILAMAAIHRGDLEQAERHVRMGLAAEERDHRSEILLAQIARLRGNPETAQALIEETLILNPDLHAAHLEMAQIELALSDPEAAHRSLLHAQALGNRTPEGHMLGADLALEAGRWGEAVQNLQALVSLGQVNANVLADLGYAHANLGNAPDAIQCWEEALALDPSHEAAAHNLAALREAMTQ